MLPWNLPVEIEAELELHSARSWMGGPGGPDVSRDVLSVLPCLVAGCGVFEVRLRWGR